MKKTNKRIAIITALCMIVTLSMPTNSKAATVSDISGHWANTTIQNWVDKDFISGYPDGTFRADNNISRAEFMTIVNKSLGFTSQAAIVFSDVNVDDWYFGAVAAAQAAGYISGYPDGTMRPDNQISREEAATIIMKIKKLQENADAANIFSDAMHMSWSKGAIGAVVNAKIMNGYPGGSFAPQNYTKRGEAVVSLDKASKYTDITAAPSVTSDDNKDSVAGMTTAMEYKFDSADWVLYNSSTFKALDLSGNHTLLVRFYATGGTPFSKSTTLIFTTEGVPLAVLPSGGGGGGGSSGGTGTIATDKTALTNAISAANTKYGSAVEGIDIGQYSTGSKDIFNTAIFAAQQVAGDIGSTQSQINQAVTNLATAEGAFNAARVTTVDKTALTNAISAANTKYNVALEGIAVGQYAAGSKDLFKAAIDVAQGVLGNAGSTQSQINQAVGNLATAEGVFDAAKVIAINKAALTDAINAANAKYTAAQEGTVTGKYTVGSRATYKAVIDDAQDVVDNEGSTQDQINQAAVVLGMAESIFNEAKIAAAKLLFTFDDGYTNDLTIAAPSLEKVGFKGTAYVTKDDTVAGQDDMMRIDSVETLNGTYGWDIGNHSVMHKHLPAIDTTEAKYTTTTEAINDYVASRDWLISNGLTRAANHVAYAYGERNQELIDGLIANGCKTARLAYYGMQSTPVANYYEINAQEVGGGNLTTVKLEIDKAVNSGATIILLMHKINNTDTGDNALYTINTTDFQSLIDYVKAYSLEGEIDVTTISEWYDSTPAGAADLAAEAALTAAKTSAHNALTAALASYTQVNYTPENWITLTGFKTTGDTAIDATTNLAGVTTTQNTAITGMSGVETIAETLAAIEAAKVLTATNAVVALETATAKDLTVEANLIAAESTVTLANTETAKVATGTAKTALEVRIATATSTVETARAVQIAILEAAKYETTVTILNTVVAGGDVLGTVLKLKALEVADGSVLVIFAENTDTANYLTTVDNASITLAKQAVIGSIDNIAVVTLTFTKNGKTATVDVTVTIEPQNS